VVQLSSPVSEMLSGLDGPNKGGPREDPAKVKEAATQFEALLIGQMMKSMREASAGGWSGDGGDQSGASMLELAEQQLSQMMASQGGLGLASLLVKGLSQTPGESTPYSVTNSTSLPQKESGT
jgi:peptidoglycan hydrolase FlgJ